MATTRPSKTGSVTTEQIESYTKDLKTGQPRKAKTTPGIYQLALWPEEQRAMPTDFVRSALFSAKKSKKGEPALQEVTLASANNISIVFSGTRLTQVHADVWEQLVHRARSQEVGTRIIVREREFLRSIGRDCRRQEKTLLSLWWAQLQATSVRIIDHKNNDRSVSVSLLPSEARQKLPSGEWEYSIKIDEAMSRLFEKKARISFIDWEKRKLLKQKPLALWLQHFFSSFSRPVSVVLLRTLSGSTSREVRFFRRRLSFALKSLVEVGVLKSAEIRKDDTVIITRMSALCSTVPALNQRQPELLGMPAPVVSEETKRRFVALYETNEFPSCLSDWLSWQGSRTADNPDKAFLGFAKRWVHERQGVLLAQKPQALF